MALHTFASKTFEADTFEAGTFTGVGVDPAVSPPTTPGHYARVAPTTGGYNRISTTAGGYQRKQVTGGYYWRRDNATSSFTAESYALFGHGITTLAEAQAFIQRFLNLIDGTTSMSAAFEEYLTTEGYRIADADVDGEGSTLSERHFLYWLDHELKRRKKQIGYVNRLSEAGWGSATPSILTDADPLGLVDTLQGRSIKIAIIDPDAVDDEDASSADGPVLVTPLSGSNNTCTLLDGSTAKTNGSSANLFTDSNKDTYRYRLWGKTAVYGAWMNMDETGGSTSTRIPNSTLPCVWLTRWSANNTLAHEVYLRRPSAFSQPSYVWNGGYPGEFPKVSMGSSLDDDTSPADVGTGNGLYSYRDQMVLVSQTATSGRNNVKFRNLWLSGKRQTAGGNFVYARQIMRLLAHGSGHSIRHCKITDCQTIMATDYVAGDFPELVDFAYATRVSNSRATPIVGINNLSDDFVFDSNCGEPASTDGWPNDTNSAAFSIATSQSTGGGSPKVQFTTTATHDITTSDTIVVSDGHTGWDGESKVGQFTVASVTATTIATDADWTGTTGGTGGTARVAPTNTQAGALLFSDGGNAVSGMRVTRNTFSGAGFSWIVNLRTVDQLYVAHNHSTAGCGDCFYFSGPSNATIEYNRISGNGRDFNAIAGKNGGGGIVVDGGAWGDCTDVVIQYNVLWNTERMANGFTRGLWTKDTMDGVTFRRNIVYRDGVYVDSDGTITTITVDINENLIVGLPEALKTKSSGVFNAPIEVNHQTLTGNVAGTLNGQTTVTNNRIWRFADATPYQETIETGPHLTVRNGYHYEVDDTLAGFTGNVAEKPDWAGDPESGDFRLTADPIGFPSGMPFTAALSKAWQSS